MLETEQCFRDTWGLFSMEPIVSLEEQLIESKQTFRFNNYYEIVQQGDGTEVLGQESFCVMVLMKDFGEHWR